MKKNTRLALLLTTVVMLAAWSLLALVAFGPGRWSLDAWILRRTSIGSPRPVRLGLLPPSS